MRKGPWAVLVLSSGFLLTALHSGVAVVPPGVDPARPEPRAAVPAPTPAAPATVAPPTITFFVASDSHFGARGMDELNRSLVQQMNDLPGTEYPPEIGGWVDTPRGVLLTGDTTDNGLIEEFAEFEKVYGLTGQDGLLRYPVYESIGNHDLNSDSPIRERAKERHGGIDYAWNWADIRMICLDMYPDAKTTEWLGRELAKVGPAGPAIVFFHYSIEGYYSNNWTAEEKSGFARALQGHNVLAIFHGHEHRMGQYLWRGHQVFRPGSPRHSSHFFLVVRVRARDLTVVAWDFDNKRWAQSWSVPIQR
jgi:Calcineurin-like phosphoesterase